MCPHIKQVSCTLTSPEGINECTMQNGDFPFSQYPIMLCSHHITSLVQSHIFVLQGSWVHVCEQGFTLNHISCGLLSNSYIPPWRVVVQLSVSSFSMISYSSQIMQLPSCTWRGERAVLVSFQRRSNIKEAGQKK